VDRSEVDTWRAVAAGWERQFAIFAAATAQLTARLIELAELQGDETVLELAGGPGGVGLAAAARLGDRGRLISTDFAPEMVDVARRRGTELGLGNVEYRTMDATAIDLDDAAVDVVLCRFGVMLTPDPAVTLGEIRRVLKPGGRASIAVWSEAERNLWISATGTAARELGLAPAPEPDAPGPFRLADPARLRSLVGEAGLEVTVLEEVTVDWHAESLDEWWISVADTSPTLAALAATDDLARVRTVSEARIEEFVAADGSVRLPGVALAVGAARDADDLGSPR
jgi:SAM-dependent methyltransferase